MVDLECIMSIPKSDLQEASKALNKNDIPQLVEWLSLKDNSIRYQAFLLLQSRSIFFNDVYPFWDIFREKLNRVLLIYWQRALQIPLGIFMVM
jgi:hypothetical protein